MAAETGTIVALADEFAAKRYSAGSGALLPLISPFRNARVVAGNLTISLLKILPIGPVSVVLASVYRILLYSTIS